MKRLLMVLFLAFALIALVALTGCGGGAATTPSSTGGSTSSGGASSGGSTGGAATGGGSTSSAAPAVSIENFSFNPATLTVKVGDSVTWTNNDSVAHTVTSDSGAFQSSQLAPGATYKFTFAKAGTFGYHCSIHPNMTGSITVQ